MNLPKIYDPNEHERSMYQLWLDSGVFAADPGSDKERFSISMPPPNETGTLSIGHALFLTLQDIMARHARQQGKDVLWLPGTDHAALAVNSLIEKKLAEEGTDKNELGREAFLIRTKEFVGNSRDTMLGQMRAMGASADWSRLRYTLDDALSRCVNETFVAMYNDELIYRGARIVNWDPKLQTTISDDEVEYVDETTTFYTFKYGPFEIGTARPETKFGDKYVVMHPDDERYANYEHGETFETEWINGPITATIIKDEAIDPTFGTGVMTITPWHSHVDFEIAERHNLDKEQIIGEDGLLMDIAGEFTGLSIVEARPKIVEKLRAKGLVVDENSAYEHAVAVNERGKGTIEPQIKLQWWVDVNKPVVEWAGQKRSLKEVLQMVVREGDITIIPKRFEKTYFSWIDNLRDWCISRQIWWGHQVPAWYGEDGETYVGVLPPNGDVWTRDPDTLDTWFSSALWTWSTLVDQEKAQDYSLSLSELLDQSPDFKAYHPTTVMETGWDIIFFWVARMILSTTYMTGMVPFKDVYLHGMVRAEDGKKMSKSRPESIIDPLEIIPKYGTDALRMALIMGVSPGNDQNWATGKIEANRNFCNKLWNMARYVENALGNDLKLDASPTPETSADHWIIGILSEGIGRIESDLAAYRFSEAYSRVYHLIWDEVADWYIEASKSTLNASVLSYTLSTCLKLAHPFAPFVTETLWQNLGGEGLLTITPWPSSTSYNAASAKNFEDIRRIVSEVRNIKSLLDLKGGELTYSDDAFAAAHEALIIKLARLNSISHDPEQKGLVLTSAPHDCCLAVDAQTARSFVESLTSKQVVLKNQITQLESRLNNKAYVEKAPQKLVDQTKEQLKTARQELTLIDEQMQTFRDL